MSTNTEPIEITRSLAIEVLTEAVKEKGSGYVYKNVTDPNSGKCVYTDRDSNPSCLVGNALARAGVPIDVLHAIDWGGAEVQDDFDDETGRFVEPYWTTMPEGMPLDETGIRDISVQQWLSKNGVELDGRAIELFGAVQRDQDNGVPWGEAVSHAIGRSATDARF